MNVQKCMNIPSTIKLMNHTKRNKITQMQSKLLFNGPNLNNSVNDFDVEESPCCKNVRARSKRIHFKQIEGT